MSVPIRNLAKTRPNVIMAHNCASAVNVQDQFVLVGIKLNASSHLHLIMIKDDYVNSPARTVTIPQHAAQQANLGIFMDYQRKELVFDPVHRVTIFKDIVMYF